MRQSHGLYRKLSQLSNRDTVSGLYNRPYFLAYLERALVATEANAQAVAVMLITLDNLRVVESLDAAAADDIVEHAAKRLQATLGPVPIAARFGDAIFTVLLGFTSQEALLATAHAVQAALETDPYRLHSGDIHLRASIGISIANPAKQEAALLIQQADLACGLARDSKDTRIHVQHCLLYTSRCVSETGIGGHAILGHAPSVRVQDPEVVLSHGVALIGGQSIPVRGANVARSHARAILVKLSLLHI